VIVIVQGGVAIKGLPCCVQQAKTPAFEPLVLECSAKLGPGRFGRRWNPQNRAKRRPEPPSSPPQRHRPWRQQGQAWRTLAAIRITRLQIVAQGRQWSLPGRAASKGPWRRSAAFLKSSSRPGRSRAQFRGNGHRPQGWRRLGAVGVLDQRNTASEQGQLGTAEVGRSAELEGLQSLARRAELRCRQPDRRESGLRSWRQGLQVVASQRRSIKCSGPAGWRRQSLEAPARRAPTGMRLRPGPESAPSSGRCTAGRASRPARIRLLHRRQGGCRRPMWEQPICGGRSGGQSYGPDQASHHIGQLVETVGPQAEALQGRLILAGP